MAELLTLEEGKALLQLCRTGRLYELEKWIASGKSLRVPPEFKTTALRVALKTNFHCLVELIARHESDQTSKNAALYDAVVYRRMDFLELLPANGADLKSVPFVEVLLNWNPKMIRLFLAGGADAISGAPFAEAFGAKIRTAIGPFLEYKRQHPELAEQLQEQLDCALRYFSKEGNLKWVSLLMWAGANPRSRGPVLGEEHTSDPEEFTTAMEEACYAESADVLKRFKPDPSCENLTRLIRNAAVLAHKDAIDYLLGLGVNPNDKPNGGSSALDFCLSHLKFESFNPYHRQRLRYEVSRTLGCIQALVEHGAQWRPSDARDITWVRSSLYECEPAVTIEVLQLLLKHNACSQETVEVLLRPPRMKEHLKSQAWHLAHLKLRPDEETKLTPKPQQRLLSRALLSRFNREELYKRVWSEPMRTVARFYRVSDVYLGKVCKALRIPAPGRGYWAKKYAGLRVRKQPPLPPID
jgi:hypothetical protein